MFVNTSDFNEGSNKVLGWALQCMNYTLLIVSSGWWLGWVCFCRAAARFLVKIFTRLKEDCVDLIVT